MVSEGYAETLRVGSALWDLSWVAGEQNDGSCPCDVEGVVLVFPDLLLFTGRARNWVPRSRWPGWATWI